MPCAPAEAPHAHSFTHHLHLPLLALGHQIHEDVSETAHPTLTREEEVSPGYLSPSCFQYSSFYVPKVTFQIFYLMLILNKANSNNQLWALIMSQLLDIYYFQTSQLPCRVGSTFPILQVRKPMQKAIKRRESISLEGSKIT